MNICYFQVWFGRFFLGGVVCLFVLLWIKLLRTFHTCLFGYMHSILFTYLSLTTYMFLLVDFLVVGIICWHSIIEDDFSLSLIHTRPHDTHFFFPPLYLSNVTWFGLDTFPAFPLSFYVNVIQSCAMTAFFFCTFLLCQLIVLEFIKDTRGTLQGDSGRKALSF